MITNANKTIDATTTRASAVPVYYSTVPRKRPILKAGLLALLAAILVTDLGVSAARAETATTGSDALLILAQQSGDRPGRPPQEAVDACADKSSGAACSFSDPDGKSMSGTCSSPDSNAPLACTPSDMPKKG